MNSLRIAMVAAEPSGDLLAAGLMARLRELYPNASFEGVGGPQMLALGFDSWEPMETLSVMGLVEVLRDLPRLLGLRRTLIRRWLDSPPDVFIGVDAPDFNLVIETRLRAASVPTVHYVSPTVWAWRQKRVRKIKAAVDLLLSIFPFEQKFLQNHGVPSEYVGHKLAADMPLQPDRDEARNKLGLDPAAPVLALLPGSRAGEVGKLTVPFLQTAERCIEQIPDLLIVVPLVNQKTRELFRQVKMQLAPQLSCLEVMGDTRNVMAAADVILTASGTATLEGLLSKRPMVVGYKLNSLTYWIARLFKLVKIKHIAMANLLADERLAPEFIQQECEPEYLVPAVLEMFSNEEKVNVIKQRYCEIHQQLTIDSDQVAADAISRLLQERGIV